VDLGRGALCPGALAPRDQPLGSLVRNAMMDLLISIILVAFALLIGGIGLLYVVHF
jgi:hypothetical protein